MTGRHRRAVPRTIVAATLGLASLLAPATPARALTAPAPALASGTDDWPMFHHDALHGGVSPDPTLSSTNAPGLTLRWQANLGGNSFTSPAVVYDARLGKTLVYQGSTSGAMNAYDAATGVRVWTYRALGAVVSSPARDGGVLYFGSRDGVLHALDATTGAPICSYATGGMINASPVVVDPDGTGKIVFFGDNGVTGEDDGGHFWAINAVDPNQAANCSLRWRFDGFGNPAGTQPKAGSWSPPAFSRDAGGRPLIVFGSSSPDCAVYALDARDGMIVWRFQAEVFSPGTDDVGAGPTISAPGVNGLAGGAVYATGKDRITYALDLGSGAKVWEFRILDDTPGAGETRSTAALLGRRLFLGYGSGVYALDAVTGARVWKTPLEATPDLEVVSSPAVAGPAGDEIVVVGSMAGSVYALDAAGGTVRWSSATGGFIYGSAAIAQGRIFIGSSDGFLYAYGLGGGSSAAPTATITAPADNSTVANPNSKLAVSGTAADDVGIRKVLVAVRANVGGNWWDAAHRIWTKTFTQNKAQLSAAGSAATGWTFSFPTTRDGGGYFAQAEAVDRDGQHTAPVAIARFTVTALGTPPETVTGPPSSSDRSSGLS
jgi:outer membrane protein assembly factor BamB